LAKGDFRGIGCKMLPALRETRNLQVSEGIKNAIIPILNAIQTYKKRNPGRTCSRDFGLVR